MSQFMTMLIVATSKQFVVTLLQRVQSSPSLRLPIHVEQELLFLGVEENFPNENGEKNRLKKFVSTKTNNDRRGWRTSLFFQHPP
jgi:hypothetical protein